MAADTAAAPTPQYPDIIAVKGCEIVIRHDGMFAWINVDGVCVLRVRSINNTITLDDHRNGKPRKEPPS